MEKVSVSRLKDQLSAYLKKVRAGETVLVTDRNQPVAQLTPIPQPSGENERVARLVAQGIIRLPKGQPLDMKEFLTRRPVIGNAGVLEALLEERREGR
ncbi:MAG: type II toxin-antitoxin system Phd/YefM family antitoxin [Steroidobacteraceae bacterium]